MAQSVTGADAAGDVAGVPYVNLKAVTVKNTKKAITINYSSQSFGNLSGVEQLLLDTDPKKPGPELMIGFARYSESWVHPMRRWKQDRSKAAKKKWSETYAPRRGTCDATVRINSRWKRNFTPVTITIRKKKGCITAKAVRVHLTTWTNARFDMKTYEAWPITIRDDLPNGARKFTPWIKQRSAKAKPRRFNDRADRVNWWNDIRSVKVDHANTALTVSVRHLAKAANQSGAVRTYLDTNGDRRPDFEVVAGDAGSGLSLTRMAGWNQYRDRVTCPSLTGRSAPRGTRTSWVSVPTSCLGDPAQVRVAVNTEDFSVLTVGGRTTDWWRGTRAWTSPIKRG